MKSVLDKLHLPNWLALVLFVTLVLRIPSFFEPYSYGDEMIYLTLGEGVRQGVPLYKSLHDNKPPLLYLTAALAGNLFWFKAILAIWNLATIIVFWYLGRALFPKNIKLQKISTVVFAALTSLPILEGNIANAEAFMIGPTILGFLLLVSPRLTTKKIFLGGILFSFSTLFKVPAFFDLPAVIIFWLAVPKIDFRRLSKNIGLLLLGFTLPILLTFVWYFVREALGEYAIAAFLQNVGYLSSFRPGDVAKPFLVRNLPLVVRVLVAGFLIAGAYLARKRISRPFLLLFVWLILSLFAVTLSERPYPHYLLQAAPAVSFFVGLLVAATNLEQVLSIIPLTIFFFVPFYYRFWYYSTANYYSRFLKFATGQTNRQDYLASFGQHVPRNYKIAKLISESTKETDKIFVWGDTALIYALAKRLPPIKFVADYHVADFSTKEKVARELSEKKPKMVILLPDAEAFPELVVLVRENYLLLENVDGAEIWLLLNERALKRVRG